MNILSNQLSSDAIEIKHQTPQPGVLRSHASLTIQTRYGQTFVYGRPRNDAENKNQIPGLLDYARRTRLIWLSVIANDPYADWQLIKIEQCLSEAKLCVRDINHSVQQQLDSLQGVHIESAQSLDPVTVDLNFQNPYGYLAAGLVSNYDQLACSIFTATHVGVLNKKRGFQMLNQAGSKIRRLFSATYEWKYTGVTREDIKNQTQNGKRAIESMGECPPDVLAQTHRALNAPDIQQSAPSVSITNTAE